jgi:hypothetical protein
MKYFEELFGSNELILRLPSILALIIYLIFSFKILFKYAYQLSIPFFILMIFNPYLIDFFALARGYGLSFAWMLMGIYYLIKFFESGNNKHLVLFHFAALLAVLSNFTLLNFYLSGLITYNLIIFINTKMNKTKGLSFIKSNKINFYCLIGSGIILYEPIRRVFKKKMLDFGGKTGFIEDTIGSVVNGLGYEKDLPSWLIILISYSFAVIVLLILSKFIINYLKNNLSFFSENKPLLIVNFILLGISFSSIIQHFVLSNDYLNGRFALFLYPLFILNFALYINLLVRDRKRKVLSSMIVILSIIMFVNFSMNMNISYCRDWKYDMQTKAVMQIISNDQQNKNQITKTDLAINWIFEPTTNFYRYIWDLNWLNKTHRNGIDNHSDYYYIFQNDSDAYKINDKIVLNKWDQINTVLAAEPEH